jgi:hypothetical protein
MPGTISGVVVMGLLRHELRVYAMRAVERETGSVADSSGNSLRRVEELLQAPTAGGA